MKNLGSLPATALACLRKVAVAVAAAIVSLPAFAYPTKAITVIVPQAPGGANDAVARLVLQNLSERIGQSIIVENRPGAGGNIGIQAAAKSPADGYTLLLTVGSSLTINPAIYKNIPFDPRKDFEPIALVATAPYVLVVNPSLPVSSVKDLIAMAKQKPSQIDYASGGNGTPNHLFAEMFNLKAGVKLNHVPYKGAAAAATDVVSGRVPVTFGSLPGVMPFVKAGKLKALGVATEKRSPLLPGVPAIGETVPGYAATSWYALFAPAGTPKDVVAKLQVETNNVLRSKAVQEKLALQGAEAAGGTPEQLAELVNRELVQWAKVVKESGASLD
ncbi:tripartite tricarboxylate transporter substrate binding protein [Cupriavidus oxalaticus]|uniref:Tripartite tricarboxylate transporter substrate binding protein n=1 Tax=Cupriavidus oxalaticus TaxID=96344 RepID=A0A375GDM7_9BURK|nr:tripartite tricarboxylate transporter substrate binding protein [Cupriavidus oxalaticus]WQD86223.1 tripartite tricarboxylate transporter substrate binding protein [Cupriavidus oxalaticus]SPC05140.1 conserved exported hypothetical protein [Cupriavidus oxalaticus]SPC18112.1 conserved exported hypothetical protein [Cupriavidus oxalaticus]